MKIEIVGTNLQTQSARPGNTNLKSGSRRRGGQGRGGQQQRGGGRGRRPGKGPAEKVSAEDLDKYHAA
ncbi:unnamed protein product, partial [Brassica rapa subsp. trilocularis]